MDENKIACKRPVGEGESCTHKRATIHPKACRSPTGHNTICIMMIQQNKSTSSAAECGNVNLTMDGCGVELDIFWFLDGDYCCTVSTRTRSGWKYRKQQSLVYAYPTALVL